MYLRIHHTLLWHTVLPVLEEQASQPVFFSKSDIFILVIRMQTFKVVESYFAAAGINSYQSTQWHLVNTKNAVFILMLSINLASTCIYSWQRVNKFEDCVDSFYWISTTLANVLILSVFIWKMPPLYIF